MHFVPWSRTARRITATAAVVVVSAVVLTGCSETGTGTSAGSAQDSNAPLLIWTDATRQPGFEAFQKANPSVKMKIETYDPTVLISKLQLFNQTGSGWPDVLFDPSPNDVAAFSSSTFNYAQDLTDLIPRDVQQGFGTVNGECTVGGKLYCLKNDIAQTVLWYDKTLMDQFGYTVPTTFDEYAALGKKVAAEHPGYLIGTAGFKFIYNDFLWSSGCPLQAVTGDKQVTINTKDPTCTRVADTLDPLIAAGVLSRSGPFDTDVIATAKEGKILMMPGASWYGDYVFKPAASYALPAGRLAAAPYMSWPGETKAYSGASGGGVYFVSKHSANLKGAAAVAQWMSTDPGFQATAPTYPAYGPAAEKWAAAKATDPFYATNPVPALQAQAQLINPADKYTEYVIDDPITATIVAKVKAGGTIASGLSDLQMQLEQLAKTKGYTVRTQ